MVSAEIIHDDDFSGAKFRGQAMFYKGREPLGVKWLTNCLHDKWTAVLMDSAYDANIGSIRSFLWPLHPQTPRRPCPCFNQGKLKAAFVKKD